MGRPRRSVDRTSVRVMRIFVINRKQDEARREAIAAQLAHWGLAYERIEAVDGCALGEAEKRAMADFPKMCRTLRVLSDGEIGCAASHQEVYRKMVSERIDEALVLEDDARLVDFKLDGLSLADRSPRVLLLTDRRHGMIWTVGYVINRAGAAAMLKYNSPIWRVADCWESVSRRGLVEVGWAVRPYVEPDRALGSVITPKGVPPHQVGLPGDIWSVVKRTFWRFAYGIGTRV